MTVFKNKKFQIQYNNRRLSVKTRTKIENATKVNNGLVITVSVKIAFGMNFLSSRGSEAKSVN